MLDAKNLLANIDSNDLVGKMLGGMATKNFAAGLLTGGVATSLLGKDSVETAAKVGGLALLGTLAYKAFGDYQQQKAAGGNPSLGGAVTQSAQGLIAQASGLLSGLMTNTQPQTAEAIAAPATTSNELSLSIIRAMIAAAKADGHMDEVETQKIMGQLESAGASAQEKILLMQEMANTPEVSSIAAAAKSPQESAQIYLAALLVCDSQCKLEQEYLLSLATALKLEPAFTASLQQELLAMSQQKTA